MATEQVSLYETIARNLGVIMAKGVPSQCTGTTFESNVLISRDSSEYVGKDVFWYQGAGAGQSRICGSFLPTNNRVVFENPFETIPTHSTSRFIIFKEFRTEDFDNSMNRSIGKAKLINLQEYVGTIAVVATQYEYAVPSGMEFIDNIRLVPSTGSDYGNVDKIRTVFHLPQRLWHIEGNVGGTRMIAFDSRFINLDNFDKQICRVEGQAKPDFSGTLINADVEEFVIANSSMLMAGLKEGKVWERLFYMFRDEVKGRGLSYGLESTIACAGRGRKVN